MTLAAAADSIELAKTASGPSCQMMPPNAAWLKDALPAWEGAGQSCVFAPRPALAEELLALATTVP